MAKEDTNCGFLAAAQPISDDDAYTDRMYFSAFLSGLESEQNQNPGKLAALSGPVKSIYLFFFF